MAEFSPEYIELCRKLAMERVWEDGDFYGIQYPSGSIQVEVNGLHEAYVDPPVQRPWREFKHWWLPLEGDWLRMLEEAEITEVVIHGQQGQYVAMDGANLHNRDLPLRQGTGSTRLEALARLWMLVTGRDA